MNKCKLNEIKVEASYNLSQMQRSAIARLAGGVRDKNTSLSTIQKMTLDLAFITRATSIQIVNNPHIIKPYLNEKTINNIKWNQGTTT